MSGYVGGDPTAMTGGARTLHRTGTQVEQAGRAVAAAATQAAGGAGYGDLAGALRRLGATAGTAIEDLGTQTKVAAALADAASHDMVTATGGR